MTQVIDFLIIAFIVFLIIRAVNRLMPKPEVKEPAEPADVTLLREIRDAVRARA